MQKGAYILKLILFVGLWLSAKVISVKATDSHVVKKVNATLNNWSLLETITNDDMIAEDGDKDIADNDFAQNQVGEESRSGFHGLGVQREVKKSDLTKCFLSSYKSTHLFIFFHCWKFLFL